MRWLVVAEVVVGPVRWSLVGQDGGEGQVAADEVTEQLAHGPAGAWGGR